MKTFLKAKLNRSPLTRDPNEFYAQVILNGKYGVSEIIDELLINNKEINKEIALDLINSFNKKVLELLATGNQVNTGLLSLSPIIKGSFRNKQWNPVINKVDVNILTGFELNRALINTNIQIIEEPGKIVDTIDQSQRIAEREFIAENNSETNHLTIKSEIEPPCGMAFRRWLCNS